MNLSLLSNVLNLTGNVICESSKIINNFNFDTDNNNLNFNMNNDNINYKIFGNSNSNKRKKKKYNINCKFHKLGKCNKGDNCSFNHNF